MKFEISKCPECGKDPIGTIECVVAVAKFEAPKKDGSFDYSGHTDIEWNKYIGMTNLEGGVNLVCDNGHDWWSKKQAGFSIGKAVATKKAKQKTYEIVTEAFVTIGWTVLAATAQEAYKLAIRGIPEPPDRDFEDIISVSHYCWVNLPAKYRNFHKEQLSRLRSVG